VDEVGFDGAEGLKLCEVGFEEGVEILLRFAGDGFEMGGEAVFDGVLGAAGFTFGCGGSLRFCAVGAGCVGSVSGCHDQGIALRVERALEGGRGRS